MIAMFVARSRQPGRWPCSAVLALLAGCSTLSPYSRLTKLDLALSAGAAGQSSLTGRPSPVVVRLFELETPGGVREADPSASRTSRGDPGPLTLVTSEEAGAASRRAGRTRSSAWGGELLRGRVSPPTVIWRGKLALRVVPVTA